MLTDASIPGALSTLSARGMRVPEDFSIVALAIDRIAELVHPKLTAVRFPSYQMGYQAVELLINKLRNPQYPVEQHLLEPELIVRESTAAAPHK